MNDDLHLLSYSYDLPEELIAQHPADSRDNSKLLVLRQEQGKYQDLEHKKFANIADYINNGDLLVVNNTKVFPARLTGKKETGGRVEVFLLEYPEKKENMPPGCARATALIKASKRPRPGSRIYINAQLSCIIEELMDDGKVLVIIHFNKNISLQKCLDSAGQVPLPPYIHRKQGTTKEDVNRYQTVYARQPGAVAAPTAGLHFTPELLEKIINKGAALAEVTLHVGYGTFAPVRQDDITRHEIHREFLTIPEETVEKVQQTKERGGKIWAIGTTSVRALEFGAKETGQLKSTREWCDLYIYPGFEFRVVDNLITNFHLPQSSLMFLVSALCGRKNLLNSYHAAIKEGYRFFSYGDAMAIIGARQKQR